MIKTRLIVISLAFLMLLSCQKSGKDMQFKEIRQTVTGGEWVLSLAEQNYSFTDRILVHVQFYSSSSDPVLLPRLQEDRTWGDFRLYRLAEKAPGQWDVFLQPRQNGISELKIPYVLDETEFLQPFADEININGYVPEDSEPAPLLEAQRNYLFSYIAAAAVLLSLGAFLYVFTRKKRPEDSQNLSPLETFLKTESVPMEDIKEYYSRLFSLLVEEFRHLHPAVKGGESPAELIRKLEEPSSLNQWALRSLYPLLQNIEEVLFPPSTALPGRDELEGYKRAVWKWLELNDQQQKEKGGE